MDNFVRTTKTYSYQKKWHRDLINSSSFKRPEGHENPRIREAEPTFFEQPEIRIGNYLLHDKFRQSLLNYQLLPLTQNHFSSVEYVYLDTIGAAICISGFYFLKYNSISNLTIYDLYFVFAVVLFIFFVHNLSVSVEVNGREVFSEDF